MKYPCNLIRDILPLYHDHVVSDESIHVVEEHLCECDLCKEYYKAMCESDIVEPAAYDEQLEQRKADSYKQVYKRVIKTLLKIVGITVLVVVLILFLLWAIVSGYLLISAEASREVYRDASAYSEHRNGENMLENFKVNGMQAIWPAKITDDMIVEDYIMVYYNPWDANYLGYLTVKYDEVAYKDEVARLAEYPSTDYIGNYGATGFIDYEVLAMTSSDFGFVYAITDKEDTIIYVEMHFPGYGMDIEYEDYIPMEYLPEGLDVSPDNPTRQAVIKENEESLRRYKESQKNNN